MCAITVVALVAPSGCQEQIFHNIREGRSFKSGHSPRDFFRHLIFFFSVLKQVSEELIRVAILWHEMWHEGLEEASRLYFGERNVKGMFEVLEPLHAMMERGPQTLKETSFNQVSANGQEAVQDSHLPDVLQEPLQFNTSVSLGTPYVNCRFHYWC